MRPEDLTAWLAAASERYRQDQVPHKGRPWLAASEYSREFGRPVVFGSPLERTIAEYFEENGPASAQQPEALFANAFYFDAHFWPLRIPIGFGNFALDPVACLDPMPDSVKAALRSSVPDYPRFLLHWAQCVDYAYGMSDMHSLSSVSEDTAAFVRNADAKLCGAVAQLTGSAPNTYATRDLGLSAEIWMKAFLIHRQNLNQAKLKAFGHDIRRLAEECWKVTGDEGFKKMTTHADLYPKVADRYDGARPSEQVAWQALSMTTDVAACVIRHFSNRGMLAKVIEHLSQITQR